MSPRFLPARSRRRKRWLRLGIAFFACLVVVLAYGFAETYRLQIKEYSFSSPDLPPAFDGLRIAFVSDIHRGPFFSQERVAGLVERVNGLEPDLVLLGGDYVFARTDYEDSCFAELASLQAPLGTYGVLGNHDYGEHDDDELNGPSKALESAKRAHITILRDQGVWLETGGARIRLGGVSDYDEDVPRLAPAIAGSSSGDFVLLVSHNPDVAEQLPPGAVDLMLSGHTHGGQVTLFGLCAFYVPSHYGQRYRTGMVTNGATTVIVSNGVGTSTIPPIRILARPQVVLVTLRAGPAPSLQP